VIYAMLAVEDGDKEKIAREYRIDVNVLLKELKLKEITKNNLNEVLLAVEINFRNLIRKQSQYMGRVIYAGQSKNEITERIETHLKEVKSQKNIHTNKLQIINEAAVAGYDIRISYLIENIPIEYLDVFEVLVGAIFKVQIFGGSAQIGNKSAWEQYKKYLKWKTRIETLEEKGLLNVVEETSKELITQQFHAFVD
jgi:hypothetical protein